METGDIIAICAIVIQAITIGVSVVFGVKAINSGAKEREEARERHEKDREDARKAREEAREERRQEWEREQEARMTQWREQKQATLAAEVAGEALEIEKEITKELRALRPKTKEGERITRIHGLRRRLGFMVNRIKRLLNDHSGGLDTRMAGYDVSVVMMVLYHSLQEPADSPKMITLLDNWSQQGMHLHDGLEHVLTMSGASLQAIDVPSTMDILRRIEPELREMEDPVATSIQARVAQQDGEDNEVDETADAPDQEAEK